MAQKRTYERTHAWITFDLRTERLPSKAWMLLGEATSKAKHIAGVPLAPERAHDLYSLFLAKGARATTAIEGNTLTEEQVRAQVDGTLRLPPSQKYLQQEIKNIIDACNDLVSQIATTGPREITPEFCLDLNRRVLEGLDLEDGTAAGEIRRHNVVVGNVYRGAPPEDCHYLLERMCDTINKSTSDGEDREATAILNALFAHMYLALIHPFGDGNGRTARLLEFFILLQAGLPQPTGHLLSNHYNMTRSRYYSELDRISKSGGDTAQFVLYALQGLVDGLKEQIQLIREEQMNVAWQNYVHEQFQGKESASDSRRRHLILHLGKNLKPIRISDIMEMTPRLAREYAGKTDKTLTRDINALVEMKLLVRSAGRRVRAKREIISAFLPWRAKQSESSNGDATIDN